VEEAELERAKAVARAAAAQEDLEFAAASVSEYQEMVRGLAEDARGAQARVQPDQPNRLGSDRETARLGRPHKERI
jgi:hypothetical protein